MASNTNNSNFSSSDPREQMTDSDSNSSSCPSSESNIDVILEVCQCQRCAQELDLNRNNPSHILINDATVRINRVEPDTLMAAEALMMLANAERYQQMNSSFSNNAIRNENNVCSFPEPSDNITRRGNNHVYETIANIRRNRPRTMPLPRILRLRGVGNYASSQNYNNVAQGNNSRFHVSSIATSEGSNTDHPNQDN